MNGSGSTRSSWIVRIGILGQCCFQNAIIMSKVSAGILPYDRALRIYWCTAAQYTPAWSALHTKVLVQVKVNMICEWITFMASGQCIRTWYSDQEKCFFPRNCLVNAKKNQIFGQILLLFEALGYMLSQSQIAHTTHSHLLNRKTNSKHFTGHHIFVDSLTIDELLS